MYNNVLGTIVIKLSGGLQNIKRILQKHQAFHSFTYYEEQIAIIH